MLVGAGEPSVTVDGEPLLDQYFLVPVHHGMMLAASWCLHVYSQHRAVGDDDDPALELKQPPRGAFLLPCACLVASALQSCRS